MTCVSPAPTEELVSNDDHLELMRLVNEFSWRIDHLQAKTLTDLVTEGAVLRIDPDVPVTGHTAIEAWGKAFDDADPLSGIRHLVSNHRFVDHGDGRASGVSLLVAFFTPEGETPSSIPFAVGEDCDTFVRSPEGWRFTSRLWVPIVMRPLNPAP